MKEAIAVDLGGSNLRVALVRDGKILKYVRVDTPKTKEELLKKLFFLIDGCNNKNVKGIGVASPGPLKDGKILNTPNIPLKHFDLKGALTKRFHKRVEVQNDAFCSALAELRLGVRKKNFIILTLGTGIGGKVVINEKVIGAGEPGWELGHIILDDGKDFEELVAGKAVKRTTKRSFGKEIMIFELARMKDKRAMKILNELSEHLGQGIASLVNIFNPEIVVLAGGYRDSGNKFLKMIQDKARKHGFVNKKINIVWSQLENPGILGASLLI